MTKIIPLALAILATINSALAQTQVRNFHSIDGKMLPAILIEANETKVKLISQKDCQTYTLPISRLSEPDRLYIQAWKEEQKIAPHHMGWERLRIFAPPGTSYGENYRSNLKVPAQGMVELTLPIGSWLTIESDHLVQFTGQADWYLTHEKNLDDSILWVSNNPLQKGSIVSFLYRPEFSRLKDKEVKQLISRGAAVYTGVQELENLLAQGTKPVALKISSNENLNNFPLNSNLQALSVWVNSPNLAFLKGLKNLKSLNLRVQSGIITDLSPLASLSNLERLWLWADVQSSEIPRLGKLTKLKKLEFEDDSDPNKPKDSYGFLMNLTKLQILRLSNDWRRTKIDPAFLANCSSLCEIRLQGHNLSDGGKFISNLPNLTGVNLLDLKIPPEFVDTLMAEGHFKHVRSLTAYYHNKLANLPKLESLYLVSHKDPFRPENWLNVNPPTSLTLYYCNHHTLEKLSKNSLFGGIESLTIAETKKFESFQSLVRFPKLASLFFYRMNLPESLPLDIPPLKSLKSLRFHSVQGISEVHGAGMLESIKIHESNISAIYAGGPVKMKSLILEHCSNLISIDKIPLSKSLKTHTIRDCPKLVE